VRTQTLVVITPAWVDDRGANIPDWDNATDTDEQWRGIQPVSAKEADDIGRQGVLTMMRGTGPPDTVLTAHCRATFGGVSYEVVSVQPWASITGGLAHSEAVFDRMEG